MPPISKPRGNGCSGFWIGALLRGIGRAIGQAQPRGRDVVEFRRAQREVRERAGLRDVDDEIGRDRELLRVRPNRTAVVEHVHRNRDGHVRIDGVDEIEPAVGAQDRLRADRLFPRIVVVGRGLVGVDELVDAAAPATLARHGVVRAERAVGEHRAVHGDRLRDLRAPVERGDRVFEARHAHAERVEFVLERVDEFLQFVEIGFRAVPAPGGASTCSFAMTRATIAAIS